MIRRLMCTTCFSTRGFTLLEMGIVLIILSLLLSGALTLLNQNLRIERQTETIKKLDAIEKSLTNFTLENNRLPCPADASVNVTASNYGFEATGAGNPCGTGVTSAGLTIYNTGGKVNTKGAVPVRALGLPDDYMLDGWGGRFDYVVDADLTSNLRTHTSNYLNSSLSSLSNFSGQITMNDLSQTRTQTAGAVLISHGPNGFGAFTISGTQKATSGTTNAAELANAGNTNVFYMMTTTRSTVNDLKTTFDDIVRYYTRGYFSNSSEAKTE